MSQITNGKLSTSEVEQYNSNGYISHRKPVFPEVDFQRLKAIFEEDLEQFGEDGLDVIHFKDPRLLEFLLSDHVLDLVEPLVGPNIGLWSSHFICKPPRVGKATPWHEDSTYWDGRVSTMVGICTVWLAIDPTSPENGSMGVMPGSHLGGPNEYQPVDKEGNIFGTGIMNVDESKAFFFTLDPNECSLHEARIMHGAHANTSEHRRCGYTMRYFPTTSKVYPEKNQGHKIWLARGVDLAGNTYE